MLSDMLKLFGSFALALLALSLAGCDSEPRTWRIGAPEADWARRGIPLAVDRINAAGGVGGRKLEVVFAGEREKILIPEHAVQTAVRLAEDGQVLAVIGHSGSSESLAAAHIYNRYGVVQVIPGASSPLLTTVGPWIFRVSASDEAQGRFLAELAVGTVGYERLGIVFLNDDYGKLLARASIRRLRELGAEYSYIGWFLGEDRQQLEAIVDCLQEARCDTLLFAGRLNPLIFLLDILRQRRLELNILAGDACFNTRINSQVADQLGGTRVITTTFYNPFSEAPAARDFRKLFRRRFNHEAESMDALVFDATMLIARAIESAGGSRRAIRQYLSSAGRDSEPFEGVTGQISLFPDGESKRTLTAIEYGNPMTLLEARSVTTAEHAGDRR